MKNQNIFTETLGLQKTAFTTTISIISTMQQHGENLLKTSLEQNPWLPGSSKRACLNMTNIYSKYWENFKSITSQSFESMEKISSPNTKPEIKESKQTKTTEQTSSPHQGKKDAPIRKKTTQVKKTVKAGTSPKKGHITESAPTAKQVSFEKPDVTKPEPTKPEPTKPEPTKPEQAKPEPTKPEQAKSIKIKAKKKITETPNPSKQKTPSVIGHKKSTEKNSLPTKD